MYLYDTSFNVHACYIFILVKSFLVFEIFQFFCFDFRLKRRYPRKRSVTFFSLLRSTGIVTSIWAFSKIEGLHTFRSWAFLECISKIMYSLIYELNVEKMYYNQRLHERKKCYRAKTQNRSSRSVLHIDLWSSNWPFFITRYEHKIKQFLSYHDTQHTATAPYLWN